MFVRVCVCVCVCACLCACVCVCVCVFCWSWKGFFEPPLLQGRMEAMLKKKKKNSSPPHQHQPVVKNKNKNKNKPRPVKTSFKVTVRCQDAIVLLSTELIYICQMFIILRGIVSVVVSTKTQYHWSLNFSGSFKFYSSNYLNMPVSSYCDKIYQCVNNISPEAAQKGK